VKGSPPSVQVIFLSSCVPALEGLTICVGRRGHRITDASRETTDHSLVPDCRLVPLREAQAEEGEED
jgi:hypothetical protein